MRQVIIVFILMFTELIAVDKDSTLKIYNRIITSIFTQQKHIKVYVPQNEYHRILKSSKVISIVDDSKKASIAIVDNKYEIENIKRSNPNIIIFANREDLIFYDNSVIGAFYWKKGRSQLIFIKNRLEKYHIKLPNEYNQFIIEL